ncbi:WD40 repeat domain-containing protein [Pedobacter sp. MC2016-14]|uniref:WD40 repeat domain-containing protein n=1 Tax=Pedobacter sp. MC2016-14 TaxID=2897327 RepID=UPI001E620C19|nr:WD40 repeat domain-containing protein [Pedobacter sp. MC2016-14]MCD0488523.1 WD40 repeat domain-containing protein [Pedobacter sp. MC2016-14]
MLKHLHTLKGHQNPIYTIANGTKPGVIYTAGNDKGVVEWSLDTMAFVKVILPVQTSVYALHRYNNLLFVAQKNGLILVFDLNLQQTVASLHFHEKAVFDIRTIPSKNELISTGEDGIVAVWSLADYTLLYHFPVINNTVRTLALSKDEKEIAIGSKDGVVRIYQSADYSLVRELSGHTFPITALQYSPEGHQLLSGSRDAQLKVWNLPDYSLQQNIPAHMFSVYSIVFHPTLPLFATCSQDKSIKIWDSKEFKLYKILSLEKNTEGHLHSVNKLLWTPDGKHLISTGDDRQVMVWDFS